MKFSIRYAALVFAAIVTTALTACAFTPTGAVAPKNVAQSVLVVFVPNSDYQTTIADIEAQHTGVYFKKMRMDIDTTAIGEFSVPKGKENYFVRRIAQHPKVQSAERNAIMHIAQ